MAVAEAAHMDLATVATGVAAAVTAAVAAIAGRWTAKKGFVEAEPTTTITSAVFIPTQLLVDLTAAVKNLDGSVRTLADQMEDESERRQIAERVAEGVQKEIDKMKRGGSS